MFPRFPKVGDGKGRASHARKALRAPRLPRYRGALEPPARFFPEAEAHQQPPGSLWSCECISLIVASRGHVVKVRGH